MSFYSFYPPVGAGGNASIGINGNPAPTESTEVGGINPSGNLQPLQTDSSGNLLVSVASEPGAPFHVIVDSSALPTGASTSANQTTEIGLLTGIEANQTNGTQETQIVGTLPLPTGASTSALQSDVQSAPGTPQTTAITVQGNASGIALPVTAATLPLPAGAATSANQTNGTQETQIVQGGNTAVVTAGGALTVDGSAVTQPISAAILPLPTGASTAALQSDVQSAPGTPQTVAITVQGNAASVPVPISGTVTSTITGNVTVVQPTGTNLHTVVDSSALPTGASTVAAQTNVQSAPGTPQTVALTIQGNASSVPVPVSGSLSIAPSEGTLTDNSGNTSGTPSTSTTIMAANATRKYVFIQNPSLSNSIWINFTSAATTAEPSILLLPGAGFSMESSYVSTEAITVISTAATSPYTAKQG